MTDKNHYVLIDHHSGYVWGEADADDAIEACKIVDIEVGGDAREYEEVYSLYGKSGYHVYLAPSGWKAVEDGQDDDEIERVIQLPLVATVTYRPARDGE